MLAELAQSLELLQAGTLPSSINTGVKYWFTLRKLFPVVQAAASLGTRVVLIMNDVTLFTCCHTVCSAHLYDLLCMSLINVFTHHSDVAKSCMLAGYLGRRICRPPEDIELAP